MQDLKQAMNTNDWIGFIGVFLILLAYVLHVMGKLKKDDLTFILFNFIGAAMACIASILLDYLPFIILEGAWALVSLISLIKYSRRRKPKRKQTPPAM